jgi:hypothetical protein
MGRGEPGILPSLTTQLLYFRQEISIRQPHGYFPNSEISEILILRNFWFLGEPSFSSAIQVFSDCGL